MALTVNIDKLIKGQVVETDRIEVKSGWESNNEVCECSRNFPVKYGYIEAYIAGSN